MDIDIRESANQAFSSGNTGPQRSVARMHGPQPEKLMRFFSKCFWFSFFCAKWKCFRNEKIFFLKRKYFCI